MAAIISETTESSCNRGRITAFRARFFGFAETAPSSLPMLGRSYRYPAAWREKRRA